MSFRTHRLDISTFTFGTGKVGDKTNAEHIAVVRAAMEAGIWFHTSSEYGHGSVFEVLKECFSQDKAHIPKMIFKVDGQSPELLRKTVKLSLLGTGKDQIDIAQVCGNPSADGLRPGGAMHDTMCELLERGLVGAYSAEIFWPFSTNLQQPIAEGLFDSVIFYLNAKEREVSNPLWDILESRETPILALRTFGGRPDYFGRLDEAAKAALHSVFERSNCAEETEFQFRLVRSLPHVRTTIGATANVNNLNKLLQADEAFKPLPPDIVDEVKGLHRQWYSEQGIW